MSIELTLPASGTGRGDVLPLPFACSLRVSRSLLDGRHDPSRSRACPLRRRHHGRYRPSAGSRGHGRDRARDDRPGRADGGLRRAACRACGGGMAGVGRRPALAGLARAGDHVHAHRARRHRRLSPALHPSELQDHALGAGAAGRARLDGGRGAGDEWVATHRQHHRFSDHPGDPHSPHVDHAPGWRGALHGLAHAHVGWMFRGKDMANPRRYAKDLLADSDLRFISRTFPLWVAVGLAIPFGLGVALTGTVEGGLTGLLWGGAVRIFLLHHATFSINSLCHFYGRRPFATGDQSRNLAWLAPVAFGEAWHNNHHAFPTSASHGLGRRQFDPSAWLITGLERCHLAWDVVRISPGVRTPSGSSQVKPLKTSQSRRWNETAERGRSKAWKC